MIREAFLRGLSTRAVGRVVALVTEEPVKGPNRVAVDAGSRLGRGAVSPGPLADDWRYLFLDGVSLRVRRPSGRKQVQLLVAYGVRVDGTRQLLWFTRSSGESQAAWESLLMDQYRRGLEGRLAPVGRDRWLCQVGGGAPDRLSPRGPSMVLGPQTPQSVACGPAAGSRGHENRRPGDLSGRRRIEPRRWPRRKPSPVGGGWHTRRSSRGYSGICPSCSRSSSVRRAYGGSCGRPM